MTIVLRCWNPVEYIQKIVFSFLTVPIDQMNYGVRHIKLKTVQNPEPAICRCSARCFFFNLLNSQKYTCVWVSFIIRLQVNSGKNLCAIFLTEKLRSTASEMEVFLSFKIYNKSNTDFWQTIFRNLKYIKWPKQHWY